MRVISGIYKGRVLKAPAGIRPTEDRVKKALFDILGDVSGLSFLELFAGSGAVGIEALSLGAKEVIFVEKERLASKILQENLNSLKAGAFVLNKDVFDSLPQFSKNGKVFDLIFLDPPYYQELSKKTLQTLSAYDIVSPCGFIVIQHFKKDILPESIGIITLSRQASYGDSVLSFYTKNKNKPS